MAATRVPRRRTPRRQDRTSRVSTFDPGRTPAGFRKAGFRKMTSVVPDGLEDLSIERDERIVQARETLRSGLEKLLRTAGKKQI